MLTKFLAQHRSSHEAGFSEPTSVSLDIYTLKQRIASRGELPAVTGRIFAREATKPHVRLSPLLKLLD